MDSTHLSSDVAEAIAELLVDTNTILVAIDGVDWDCDLTPWPAAEGNHFANIPDRVAKGIKWICEMESSKQ